MKTILNPSTETWDLLTQRPSFAYKDINPVIDQVFDAVKEEGDIALKRYTQQFDSCELDAFRVSERELKDSVEEISLALKSAIDFAYHNIKVFHEAQRTADVEVETTKGVRCWQAKKPIQKVGLYIPGGTAPLFSTILMLAIPAQLAGCSEIVLCTPPQSDGTIAAAIRYAAQLCGVSQLFKIGGIQAIAALTYGTESVPKVYKIFGPGNQYVTAAKQKATTCGVAIDMPAGPSELLVIADQSAVPSYVAADLLSQAEHGKDSQVVLVSTSLEVIDNIKHELQLQLLQLHRRDMAQIALEHAMALFFDDESTAVDFINAYSPEHYIICMKNEDFFVEAVQNAGSVFIGNYTPESVGDYASGTNHTLPTNGFAKQYSGVNLDSFMKAITFQKLSKTGILKIGKAVEEMADAEGLDAHKNAVRMRLKDLI